MAYVFPRVGQAPAVVRIQALVEPADENRQLEFVVDSDAYYSSSTVELSGAGSARVHTVEFRSIPGGAYDVRVVLRGGGGEVRAVSNDRVVIID
jgi:hypothetical protein